VFIYAQYIEPSKPTYIKLTNTTTATNNNSSKDKFMVLLS